MKYLDFGTIDTNSLDKIENGNGKFVKETTTRPLSKQAELIWLNYDL